MIRFGWPFCLLSESQLPKHPLFVALSANISGVKAKDLLVSLQSLIKAFEFPQEPRFAAQAEALVGSSRRACSQASRASVEYVSFPGLQKRLNFPRTRPLLLQALAYVGSSRRVCS